MHIKLVATEDEKQDFELFLKECESKGYHIIRRGGGRMPNFSGYYAEVKGSGWEGLKQ